MLDSDRSANHGATPVADISSISQREALGNLQREIEKNMKQIELLK